MIDQSDHRTAGNGDARAVFRAVMIGVLATLAVGCIHRYPMELEPADFYVINGCSVPIVAAGGPQASFFSGSTSGPPIPPGRTDTWATRFDLANTKPNDAFFVWVESASTSKWGEPHQIAFADMDHEVTDNGLDVFYFEVTGALCPSG